MSEVAIHQPAPAPAMALPQIQSETTKSLVSWAGEMQAANAIAKAVCGTMFAPVHFRNKPDEATAAILYGYTLEMPPMVSLKTIYVVHGTPALYAQQMYAIALSKGHEIERVHFDEERVVFRCRRRGSSTWQAVEWTIQRAQKAGYTSNAKYRENPIGMLTEKCKAEAAKLVAPDALAGMASVEEIELGELEYAPLEQIPTEPAKPKATRQRKPVEPLPVPDVALEVPEDADEPDDAEPAAEVEPGITAAQLTKLNIVLQQQGLTERADKLAYLSTYLERPIASSKDLTKAEAHRLIDEHDAA